MYPKKQKIKQIFKLLTIPLILLGIYLIVIILWNIFHLPSEKEMIEILKQAFLTYGSWIVLVGAFLEGLLFIGFYFPGATIVFVGIILAGVQVAKLTEVVIMVSVAFIVSYSINYFIGKYGWYKLLHKMGLKKSLEGAKEKLHKNSLGVILLSYWSPNFASIVATAAGVLGVPFWKFFLYNIIGIIGWNVLWAVLAAILGANLLQFLCLKYVLLSILIWILVILIKYYFWDRKKSKN